MTLLQRAIALSAALLVLAAVAAFVAGAGFSSSEETPTRDVSLSAALTESPSDSAIADLQRSLRDDPQSLDALTSLASAYLQKSRETGDPSYYARAERVLHDASRVAPNDARVLAGRSALALARHDFAGALALSERLPPDLAATHALRGDALVELGRYDEAFAAFERMAAIKPDSAALARIAYARELTGDRPGAIEAMASAVEAAGASGETAAWLRVQLGHLHFGGGDLDAAGQAYDLALAAFPGYPHALAGLGRVAAARGADAGDFDQAIERYRAVVDRFPLPEYVIALGDVYAAAGRHEEASRQYELVAAIDALFQENGVNTDLDLALFFANHDRVDAGVVRRIRAAYEKQPSVHAADVLSWVLYKAGLIDEARGRSREALRLGTKDALALFHAGTIARAAGDDAEGRALRSEALTTNPYFSLRYAAEARDVLAP